jgi:serine/threonine protein kinase
MDNQLDKMKHHPAEIGNYSVISYLGSGVYGSVYLVKDKEEKKWAATKMAKFEEASLIELDRMMRINHPHIIKAKSVIRHGNSIYLIEELASEMSDVLNKLTLEDKIRVVFELGSALKYLQDQKIVHCDFKIDNVLQIDGRTKLTDLGISRYVEANDENFPCENVIYRPPEYMYLDKKYAFLKKYIHKDNIKCANLYQSELWSYGMTCLDILYGVPYAVMKLTKDPEDDEYQVFMYYLLKGKKIKDIIIEGLGEPPDNELLNLIVDKLLQVDLNVRIKTFVEFIEDDLFKTNGFECCHPICDLGSQQENTIIPKEDRSYFEKVQEWLFEVEKELKMSVPIAFLSFDLLRRKWTKYVNINHKRTIQLFGVSCMYLAERVYGYPSSAEYYSGMTDDAYTAKEIEEYAFNFFIESNGIINGINSYDLLCSVDMLVNFMKKTNTIDYYTKTRKKFAQSIIDETLHHRRLLKRNTTFEELYRQYESVVK